MRKSKIASMALKAMGVFGGVQVVGILCSIVRTKLVALWIGPVGVGLFGLFNQALEMLNTATNLGIRSSSVRDISKATGENDRSALARIIYVVRRWSLWLGFGGAIITVALAPALSQATFDDYNHSWHFVALAGALALTTLTNGEYAVMQGMARLKRLANITLCGTLGGLLVSIPLFYYLREQSIIPSIIAYAACCAVAAFAARRYDRQPAVNISAKEVFSSGAGFIKLGIYMTIGVFVTMLASYAFSAWLNRCAGTSEVGLYQAGYTIINKYTGLVFTALGMEYYPRLAKIADSRLRLNVFVTQEINVALMVLVPLLALFIVVRDPVIALLYSAEFSTITSMVAWGLIGTIFRALSWCMAFVILAKGDGKIFLITEGLSAACGLTLNMMFYNLWGINSLGAAYLCWYVIYSIIIAVVYFSHYHLAVGRRCLIILAWATIIVSATAVAALSGYTLVSITLAVLSLIPTVVVAKKML